MAKVMITGGYGTIGRWVVKEMVRQRHEVTVFELDTPRNRKVARELSGVPSAWGDLRNADMVAAAVAGQDVVLHMAFVLTPATERDPKGSHEVNIGGTSHIIDACRAQTRPPRLLFCSSGEVFGKTRHLPPPRRITDPRQATSVYTSPWGQ